MLLKRFKKLIEIALIYFIFEKYIFIDIRNRRDFSNYI